MPPTKIQAEPPSKAGPTPNTEKQPEPPEQEAGMAHAALVQRAVADALPPPNGTPPAARAGDLLTEPPTGPGAPRAGTHEQGDAAVGGECPCQSPVGHRPRGADVIGHIHARAGAVWNATVDPAPGSSARPPTPPSPRPLSLRA